MLFAFFDESGTHGANQPLGVAGVVYDDKPRKELRRQWRKQLDRAGVAYFHAVDLAHLRGPFFGKKREEADRLHLLLTDLAQPYARRSIVVCSVPELFDPGHWPASIKRLTTA
jgi:hypothetical protein